MESTHLKSVGPYPKRVALRGFCNGIFTPDLSYFDSSIKIFFSKIWEQKKNIMKIDTSTIKVIV